MNKSELVDALAERLGDRRTAATAVDALLQIVVDTVRSGGSVSITGFGVFESRARAARTGRNPRTGETVDVPATTVPAFRPGTGFRHAVAGEETPAAAAPTRGARATPATNGSGGARAGAALDGAVELKAPEAAVLTDEPAEKKPAAKKPAAKASTKPAKKADAKKSDKKSAKGKKSKK
jgi:DNA-binding protein HU-beta